jgi:uncharacterized protein (DUF1697 family)
LDKEFHGMPRYFAFLRAINVGGHVVKMERLRNLFEAYGFSEVETFIASGNVIFQAGEQDARVLESQIEKGLQATLGYEVAAFIRTEAELAQIAEYRAFPPAQVEAATAFNIAFLHKALHDPASRKLMELTTDIDAFASHGREVYWLCQKKQSESTFSNAVLEKRLGVKSTIRGAATLQKLAARSNLD